LAAGPPPLHRQPARSPPEGSPRLRGGRAGSMPGKPVAPLAGPPAWTGRSNALPRLRERVGVGASRWRQCPDAPLPTSPRKRGEEQTAAQPPPAAPDPLPRLRGRGGVG